MPSDEKSSGEFVLDATVVDEKENAIFSISVTKDRIVVAPLENCDSLSFLRFYRVVCEHIDPEAERVVCEHIDPEAELKIVDEEGSEE